jgi:hypothetical protein
MSALLVGCLLVLVAFISAVLMAVLRLGPMFGQDLKRSESVLSDDRLASRYRPMDRLLRESEWDYLASQPGFDSARIRTIKSERRKLFRGYLKCMSADFASVCYLIRVLMVQSPVARPDLAKAIGKFRLQYAIALMRVEVRLLAHTAGVTSVAIDVSGLTSSLEQLGAQLRSLQVVPAQMDFA